MPNHHRIELDRTLTLLRELLAKTESYGDTSHGNRMLLIGYKTAVSLLESGLHHADFMASLDEKFPAVVLPPNPITDYINTAIANGATK